MTIDRAVRMLVLGLLYVSEAFALVTLASGDEGGGPKGLIVVSQLSP